MAGGSAGSDVQTQLMAAFALGGAGGLSDGQLLGRFLGSTDAASRAAFDALVARHGPMVRRACLRAAGDPHDAQDAFQATFLILARKAGSVRDGESLAGWLHGVALRVGGRARADAARRREYERRSAATRAIATRAEADSVGSWDDLHAEVARLPRRYREPIVLCYLEGLTAEAAASRIGCPRGTVLSRLSRARERLRQSLTRRGLAPPATLFAGVGQPGPALPPALVSATTHAAMAFSGRGGTDVASASAAALALAKEILNAMMISKLKFLGAIAAAALLTLGGARTLAIPSEAGEVRESPADGRTEVPGKAEGAAEEPHPSELSRLALEDAKGIDDPSERAEALLRLGVRMGERGLREAGLDTLRLALDAAAAIPPNAQYTIPHPAMRVARAMAGAGHRAEARHAFSETVRIVLAEDESHQAQNWLNLPDIQLEAEGRIFAAEMIAGYRKYLLAARPRSDRPPAVVEVLLQAMSGDIAGALRAVQDRPEFQGPGRVKERRSAALAIVDQLQPGDQDVAGPALAEAEAAIHAYAGSNPNAWTEDLLYIAEAETKLGWFDRAIATVRALNIGQEAENFRREPMLFNQALAFTRIARSQARAGDKAGACASAREALAVVGKIREETHKGHPRSQACIILAENGDAAGALREASGHRPSDEMDVLPLIESERRRAGDEAGVRDTLRRELECTEAIRRMVRERDPVRTSPDPQFDRLMLATADVAKIRARMGDSDAALREIESLPPGDLRDEGLARLALDRAVMGDESGAASAIGRIMSPKIRRKARIGAAFQGPKVPASRD